MPQRALAPDLSALGLDEAFRYRETQPDTAVIVAPRLPEIVEEMPDIGRSDSGPRVSDVNVHVIADRDRAHRHVSLCRREFDRIAKDISHDLRNAQRIGANRDEAFR